MRQGKGAMNGRKFLAKGKKKKEKKKKKKLRYRDLSQFYWNANERQQRLCNYKKKGGLERHEWRDTDFRSETSEIVTSTMTRCVCVCVCARVGRHDVKLTLTICRSGCCKKKEDTTKKIDNNQYVLVVVRKKKKFV